MLKFLLFIVICSYLGNIQASENNKRINSPEQKYGDFQEGRRTIFEASHTYLQNKFQQAHAGDYIVTAQDNTYTLLLLGSVISNILLLEEVCIPSQQVDLKKINWRKWLSEKAPGHTSWTLYEIDLKKGQLIECFSYSKKGWIYLDKEEQFFAKLFTLNFSSVSDAQKKKIGPQPSPGEVDHRKLWKPALIIESKKNANPVFEVVQACWPDDNSQLALCRIDLYFDAEHPSFAFPYWIEVKSSHYSFKVRSIESGHDLSSPIAMGMPHRPPELTGPTKKTRSCWTLPLQAPLYHDSLHLFAVDLASQAHIPIPHRFERQEKEASILNIDTKDLKKLLQPDHRYQWIIRSDKTPSVYVKSEEVFTWKFLEDPQ